MIVAQENQVRFDSIGRIETGGVGVLHRVSACQMRQESHLLTLETISVSGWNHLSPRSRKLVIEYLTTGLINTGLSLGYIQFLVRRE